MNEDIIMIFNRHNLTNGGWITLFLSECDGSRKLYTLTSHAGRLYRRDLLTALQGKSLPAHILWDMCVSMCAVCPTALLLQCCVSLSRQQVLHVFTRTQCISFCLFVSQALASIFQSCSPLLEGCRRNRKNCQQLVKSGEEEDRKKRNKKWMNPYEEGKIAFWGMEHSKNETSHVWYSDFSHIWWNSLWLKRKYHHCGLLVI